MENKFKRKETSDAIKPNHYKFKIKGNEVQVFDIQESMMSAEAFKGFLIGNIVKYIFRAPFKNGLEDYKKAARYLAKLIEVLER